MREQGAPTKDAALRQLRRPLRLTRLGMIAERATQSFWPLWSIILAAGAALMLGLQDMAPLEILWGATVLAFIGAVAALIRGALKFRLPSPQEALERLDRTLPGRPITALGDSQAIGAGDGASEAVWNAHMNSMAGRIADARAARPDLRVSGSDPFALRYVAVLAFAVASLFGSVLRIASVAGMAPVSGNDALATGPSWEGWIEPPAYTGKPSLYLRDIPPGAIHAPEASSVTLRLYGEIGDLTVAETVSGRIGELPSAADAAQNFSIVQDGQLSINGPGGAEWKISVIEDTAPAINPIGEAERGLSGEMRHKFIARDDYGVTGGHARIMIDLAAVDRRHGLAAQPEPRDAIILDLPTTISGDRTEFEETLIENLAEHPWAALPVKLELFARDALGQEGASMPEPMILPGRRFFDPLAGAIAEMRRDLLWSRENGPRAAQVLRAISHQPGHVFDSETAYLKLRVALRRLELFNRYGLTAEQRDEIAQALWNVALLIEDGNIADAAERLREARERLQEAIRNGATDEEIAELMQELREAMQEYMRQLAEQQRQDGSQQADNRQNTQEISGDQLQQLFDRLQELMQQGRMDEARQLLDRLSEMMENMQVAQGQQGQGPGQQAMNDLAETLRQQQGLSDETFGDLQEQFNQDGQPGEGRQPGRQGEAGQGGQQPGQDGSLGNGPQFGQGQGRSRNSMPRPSPGQGSQPAPSRESLADRQQALRQELNRQAENLPSAGTQEGDSAREALGRAGRAMDGAENALRENKLAEALDNQSAAIEALREGMRNLGEALAQQQPGQQGIEQGSLQAGQPLDPLGREAGSTGPIGSDDELLQGDDVYRQARELLDEIRRRSGDQSRPDEELNYLRRLLDRF